MKHLAGTNVSSLAGTSVETERGPKTGKTRPSAPTENGGALEHRDKPNPYWPLFTNKGHRICRREKHSPSLLFHHLLQASQTCTIFVAGPGGRMCRPRHNTSLGWNLREDTRWNEAHKAFLFVGIQGSQDKPIATNKQCFIH